MSQEDPKAFPGEEIVRPGLRCLHTGMSLRDYFAAKAMQGLCAVNEKGNFESQDQMWKVLVEFSYCIADEMLKQRSKS